jgi:hypothetical protein
LTGLTGFFGYFFQLSGRKLENPIASGKSEHAN